MNMDGAAGGYLNYLNNSLQRQGVRQQLEQNANVLADQKQKKLAEQLAGQVLMGLGGAEDAGAGGMLPPAPAMEAQAPLPGTQSMPSATGQPPVGTGTVLAPPAPGAPQPYLSMDDAVAKAQQPALPAAPAAPAMPAAPQRTLSIGNIVKGLKQQKVADDMVMQVLKVLEPAMSMENKAEVAALNSQLRSMELSARTEANLLREESRADRLAWDKAERDMIEKGKLDSRAQRDLHHVERMRVKDKELDLRSNRYAQMARTDEQKIAVASLNARRQQLRAIGSEFSTLANILVNGNAAQRPAAEARMEELRKEYDLLYNTLEDETDAFLGSVGAAGGAPAKPAAAAPSGSKPTPTQADRDWVKKNPGDAAKFKAHFGVDP